jgi:hypothetical protein
MRRLILLLFHALLGLAMRLQGFLVRLGRVFEGLPGEFMACLMILLGVMIGGLPMSMRSKIMHLGGYLM